MNPLRAINKLKTSLKRKSLQNKHKPRTEAFRTLLEARKKEKAMLNKAMQNTKAISGSSRILIDGESLREAGILQKETKEALRKYRSVKAIERMKIGEKFRFESERGNLHEGKLLEVNTTEGSFTLNEKGQDVKYRIDRIRRTL